MFVFYEFWADSPVFTLDARNHFLAFSKSEEHVSCIFRSFKPLKNTL